MRIRSIKPDFWKSEKVASLPAMTRLLFIGLWNLSDDAGRFRAHPSLIQGEVFPYEPNVDVGDHLLRLAAVGLIQVYEVEGRRYGLVVGFAEHQKIDKRMAPRHPAPPNPPDYSAGHPESTTVPAESTPVLPDYSAGPAERSGWDRIGGDRKGEDRQTDRGSALLSGEGVLTPSESNKATGAASLASGVAAARRVRT
jgi:hypothetical protein